MPPNPSVSEAMLRAVPSLRAFAISLCGNVDRADDLVQETLLRAWRHPDSLLNGKGSIRGWLFTVARNIITDLARARAARPTEVAETPYSQPIEQDHANAVVDSMVVVDAMQRLSDEHREVLVETYFHGRSVTEAAKALGIPPGTVKSRSYYALRALRDTISARPATLRGVGR